MEWSFELLPLRQSCTIFLTVLCWSDVIIFAAASHAPDSSSILYPSLHGSANYLTLAFLATVLGCAFAVWVGTLMRLNKPFCSALPLKKLDSGSRSQGSITSGFYGVSHGANGVSHAHMERHSSMVEELVPEITHHALSYLDYKSLCRVSMTNSAMRRVANDDSAWRALYHKDFTVEQDNVIPRNGWKRQYAVTKAVAEVNKNFYKKFKAKSLRGMSRLWLKAEYVKCIHPGGELLSGYDLVMENWRVVFNWSQHYDFQLKDVRVRVAGDIAWVTAKEFVNNSRQPLLATNCFEYHDRQWYIVHHHSSPQIEGGGEGGMFM